MAEDREAPGSADQRFLTTSELIATMRLLGVNRIEELDGTFLHPADPVTRAHVLSAFPRLSEHGELFP